MTNAPSSRVHAATMTLLRARTAAGPLWVATPSEFATMTSTDIAQIKIVAAKLNLTLTARDGGLLA